MTEPYDVAIVGLGPTGVTLAALLGQQGRRVLAIDREPGIYNLPRAVHFDHEIMRVFQSIGAAEEILPATAQLSAYRFLNADGVPLIEMAAGAENMVSGWRQTFMFFQPELEGALRRRMIAWPTVDVRLRHEFRQLKDKGDRVRLALRDLGGDADVEIEARFVVGADGASSPVRRAVALELDDLKFDEPWLVIDILLTADVDLGSEGLQLCDPKRPTTVVPMSPGRRRWEFMLLPGEDPERMRDPDVVWGLLKPWVTPDQAELVRTAVYRFHGLVANNWRRGRVILAGDAAHQMPPFMGQGMCSGIRDADNLAWKLGLVLDGHADVPLLDTYAAERSPHVRQIVETAIAMGRIICTLDPDVAAERDKEMLAAREAGGGALTPAMPGIADGLIDIETGGALFLQGMVEGQGGAGRFDDVVGGGLLLLVDADTALTPAADDDAWRMLGGRIVRIGTKTQGADLAVRDQDGRLSQWLAARGGAVLVRPDHYVYAAGSDPARLIDQFVAAVSAFRAVESALPRAATQ